MAYLQGTATSPIDLLQQIVNWLNGLGWTTNRSAVEGAGWTASLNKGGIFVHLRAAMNESPWQQGGYTGWAMLLYLSSAYDSGQPWNNQPGSPPIANGTSSPVGVGLNLLPGAIQNFYFFADAAGNNIVLVVEKSPGVYAYLLWGNSLQKCGAWTGGPYFAGSSEGYAAPYQSFGPPSPGFQTSSSCPGAEAGYALDGQVWYVRVDVDAFVGKWVGSSRSTYPPYGYTGKNGDSSICPAFNYGMPSDIPVFANNFGNTGPNYAPLDFQFCQTSSLDSRANLLPVLLYAQRDNNQQSLLGSIPFVFATNGVGNGFSQASEYVLSTQTYKMFPNFAVLKQ